VTLHGGPGACHNYLLSLAALATEYNIPVIFYDQLGNGNSTHLREKRLDTCFWTPELFMAELENLLEHLGIASDYDLLGQSWGGMLGSMWGIRGHQGLKRLIISNSPASMKLWVEACNVWRTQLPREIDDVLEKCERDQNYTDPEYQKAVMYFYKRHLCLVNKDGKPHGPDDDVGAPFPKDVRDSLTQLEQDDTVYFTMNGPSEFTVVGSLKTWDVTGDLHKIAVPTLVLNGEFDEARDRSVSLSISVSCAETADICGSLVAYIRSSPTYRKLNGTRFLERVI
jgi:proline-specific peptidase